MTITQAVGKYEALYDRKFRPHYVYEDNPEEPMFLVGICFINNDGEYDETEFDLMIHDFEDVIDNLDHKEFWSRVLQKLKACWIPFCVENGLATDSIEEVDVCGL